jgi:hypothetical protein
MTDDWDDDDRAIARALDAGTDAETHGADEELVDGYREVLGDMPFPEVTPRPELEDQVVAAALARRPAVVPTMEGRRARRRRNVRLVALGAAAIAAAVVIGIVVDTSASNSPAPVGHITPAAAQHPDVDALLQSPGARTGTFDPAIGKVVIAADGNGAVYALTETGAVSLALVSRGGTTVIGPTEGSAGTIAFVVDRPDLVTAVTVERDGSSIARAQLTPS